MIRKFETEPVLIEHLKVRGVLMHFFSPPFLMGITTLEEEKDGRLGTCSVHKHKHLYLH